MKFVWTLLCTGWLALLHCSVSGALVSGAPGTLAHHLATNAASRVAEPLDLLPFRAPNSMGLDRITGASWSRSFWLQGARGLGATPIGFTNLAGGQGLPTMISPRHFVCATHMHPEAYTIAFLDTNGTVHYRRSVGRLDVGNDTSVGLLEADLPASVGFVPVLPRHYTNHLVTGPTNFVQGIGMNQDFQMFGQPLNFSVPGFITWDPGQSVPGGLDKRWNITLRGGDSSNPVFILVENQLVLVSHNYFARGGPNYAVQFDAINAKMRELSRTNNLSTDYQLTEYPLTNWPTAR